MSLSSPYWLALSLPTRSLSRFSVRAANNRTSLSVIVLLPRESSRCRTADNNRLTAWGGDVVYTVRLDVGYVLYAAFSPADHHSTPPQSLDFILDATNNVVGLLETPCATCAPGVPLFDSKKSSTWTAAANNSLVGAGDLGTDVVAIGGHSTKFEIGELLVVFVCGPVVTLAHTPPQHISHWARTLTLVLVLALAPAQA